jgi:flavin reductase (DIM6/NTAB) family NADH-FMN oxidoreductase RutF
VTVDPLQLRRVLSRFPTGVTIVATKHVPEGVCGLTVNAFASVSLEPPLVLVCVDRGSNTHGCIEASGIFTVNVLATGQEHLAETFAQKREDKFDGLVYEVGDTGAPVIEGVVAWLACRVTEVLEGGDHTIFLGEVLSCEELQGRPLVFFRSGFTTTVNE